MDKVDPTTYLVEILDYYKHKLVNGKCSLSEIESVTKAIEENMEIDGTISDFAQFFGVPEVNVRATISRRLISKPKRKVTYPFHKLLRVVPDKWHKKR